MGPMQHLQHFIFDFAGTLFDDAELSFFATQETILRLGGEKISREVFFNEFTIPAETFYYKFLDKKIPFSEINSLYFEIYPEFAVKGSLRPGVMEVFEELKRQKKTISIFSTIAEPVLKKLVDFLHLDRFRPILKGGVLNKEADLKPFLKKHPFKAEETLYVGDMDVDVLAANRSGVMSGAVLSRYQPLKKVAQAKPQIVWSSPIDLFEFLKTLEKRREVKKAKPYPVVTVGALVFNQKKECLLILTDKWSYTFAIPGGKIDKDETSADALLREFQEETGLTLKEVSLFMVQDCIRSDEFYVPDSHFIFLNYIASTDTQHVVLNDEAQSFLWVDPKEALHLKLNRPTRLLIEKYVAAHL
jgi:ADP-ribose pyrophosphatase YjhB (NUDIX family)/phosphoglycolate phosphatase-like HAD superfamily hydrolase